VAQRNHTDDGDHLCLHHRVDRVAAHSPRAIAVAARDGSVTYEELNARATLLACHLVEVGVRHGDVIGLSMSRSIDVIVSMLAVLKAGAAYLPLEKNAPPARRAKFLDDARVTHVISDRDCSQIADSGRKVVLANAVKPASPSGSNDCSLPDASLPEDKAYVMFTSGSTGEAKGVVVPHRAITRLVIDTNYIRVSQADKILQLAPLSFDASTFEIWGALLNGATLILSRADVVDPNAIKADVAEHGVTIMWLTAALFHLIGDRYIEAIRPVKTLLAGGDVLSPRVVNKVLDAIPDITVINGYGPTENTTFTCCHRMTRENRPAAGGVPIGRPISGTEVFVLNESLTPVAVGEVGELFTSGKGVALGYLNGDGAGSFFHDAKVCTGLIYRTGDLVLENPSGELEFVGRKDNLVKVRGFRISLDGVRQSLLRVEDVVDAVVFVRKEEVGEQLLIAHVKRRQGSTVEVAQIRRQLGLFLSDYMIPDSIILSEVLPITMNGKLDRTLLMSRAN
jgi:amino acid adenylation domain-containing protein